MKGVRGSHSATSPTLSSLGKGAVDPPPSDGNADWSSDFVTDGALNYEIFFESNCSAIISLGKDDFTCCKWIGSFNNSIIYEAAS